VHWVIVNAEARKHAIVVLFLSPLSTVLPRCENPLCAGIGHRQAAG
jgi:hypothetical protein